MAVDLGGTRIGAAVVTEDGELIHRRAEPTPQDATCPDALMTLVGPIREALDRRGPPELPTPIELLTAILGDDGGLVGAAGWRRAWKGPCHG